MTTTGRRHPPILPDITKLNWPQARLVIWNHLMYQGDAYDGHPAPHQATHLLGASDALQFPGTPTTIRAGITADAGAGPSFAAEDHVHDISTGTPVALGTALAEGTGEALARASHVHPRAIEVLKAAVLVAVRRMLNFIDSASVTVAVADNAGNDRVDVTLTATGAGLAPAAAQYLTLAVDGTLTAERVLTPDDSTLRGVDSGANAAYTLSQKDVLRGSKALTNGVHTGIFKVAVPSNGTACGRVQIAVHIDDGTDFEAYSELVNYAAVNKAGALTLTATAAGGASAFSAGGMVVVYVPLAGTNEFTFRVRATSSLGAPSTLTCKYQVLEITGQTLTAL